MEKLVMIDKGRVLKEVDLSGKRVMIGRDPMSDVCLNDTSVSRHHAAVVRIFNEYFLEDLRSTNGTKLNGHEIRKHFLKHGDRINLGVFEFEFQVGEDRAQEPELDRTVVLHPADQRRPAAVEKPAHQALAAHVLYLDGPERGKQQALQDQFFTIGKPGIDLALINRRHRNYVLLKLAGDTLPKVNGTLVRAGGHELQDGDLVEFAEHRLRFFASPVNSGAA